MIKLKKQDEYFNKIFLKIKILKFYDYQNIKILHKTELVIQL